MTRPENERTENERLAVLETLIEETRKADERERAEMLAAIKALQSDLADMKLTMALVEGRLQGSKFALGAIVTGASILSAVVGWFAQHGFTFLSRP